MKALSFETLDPLAEVSRAMDLLRKMGFELNSLIVAQSDGGFSVRLHYLVVGNLTAHTLLERLKHGSVWDVQEINPSMAAASASTEESVPHAAFLAKEARM